MIKNESRSQKRIKLINFLYKYELINQKIDLIDAFENNNFNEKEIKMIEQIEKSYEKYKQIISIYLNKNWTWERILPLERAILIFGCFELSFNNKAQTINEIINYSKLYIAGDSYKFINAILNKVGDYYETIKRGI